mmetsp:Transcript_38371/g.95460  ORF Transcript_38371/g.95460 Transcript_38371/m.95460 type:complete len:410 (+) Transcript_38371:849-2078(+)
MDEHPLPWNDELGVRTCRQVVGGESLCHDRCGDVQADAIGDREQLGDRDSRVLRVGAEDRVGNRVADLEARRLRLGGDGSDRARALLPADEGERLGVRGAHRGALAEVSVDEVEAGVLVLHQHLPVGDRRGGVVGLVPQVLGGAVLTDHDGLHCGRDGRHVAAAGAEGTGRPCPRGVELDALGGEELAEGGLRLDGRLEWVVAAWRAGVLDELLLDDHLDLLAAVRVVVHLLRHRGGDAHHAVLVADDRVARPDDHLAAADHAVALPRLHRGGALLGRGGVREDGEAVVEQLVGIAHRAVGDQPADSELLEAEELDVAADRLPRADGRHDQHLLRAALLEGLVLGRLEPRRLVRRDVRPLRHELERDGAAGALLPRAERAGALDEGVGPAHHPQPVDERLRGERGELLE